MFQTKVVEKFETSFTFNTFFIENLAVFEIMWKNILDPARPRWQYNSAHALYMLDT
jgi:hypothetical protein